MTHPWTAKSVLVIAFFVLGAVLFLRAYYRPAADDADESDVPDVYGAALAAEEEAPPDTPATRANLARTVRTGGYGALTNSQKNACTAAYLSDLHTLHRAVSDRLRLSLSAIPGFQSRPQYRQMVTALNLLDRAIADLQQHGAGTDSTRYQALINEVNQALRRQ